MDENCFINRFYDILKPYHELKSRKRGMPLSKSQGNVIPVMLRTPSVDTSTEGNREVKM